ncbi:MAG: hypothetical protein JXB05_10245 [Myxococcaceae bacterium]|nr:hypothetical protein [Myxococcaceae bacterium]
MSPPPEEVVRIGDALNDLGHLAAGHPLKEMRRSSGDVKLRELIQESATILLDMVVREEKHNPKVVPRSADARAALSQLRDLVRSIDWDDAEGMQGLKACARQALEALGFGVPD